MVNLFTIGVHGNCLHNGGCHMRQFCVLFLFWVVLFIGVFFLQILGRISERVTQLHQTASDCISLRYMYLQSSSKCKSGKFHHLIKEVQSMGPPPSSIAMSYAISPQHQLYRKISPNGIIALFSVLNAKKFFFESKRSLLSFVSIQPYWCCSEC